MPSEPSRAPWTTARSSRAGGGRRPRRPRTDVERAALDAHLALCASCQALVASSTRSSATWHWPRRSCEPPASLRGDVLDSLRVGRPSIVASLGGWTAGAARDRRDAAGQAATVAARSLALGMAAVLGVVAIGFAARTVQLTDEVASVTAALAAVGTTNHRGDRRDASSSTDPAHVAAALHAESVAPAASAVVLYRPGAADAYLLATDLPVRRPTGRSTSCGGPMRPGVHALGTFTYDGAVRSWPRSASTSPDGTAAMVTLESAGGATGEPGPQVVFGEL